MAQGRLRAADGGLILGGIGRGGGWRLPRLRLATAQIVAQRLRQSRLFVILCLGHADALSKLHHPPQPALTMGTRAAIGPAPSATSACG